MERGALGGLILPNGQSHRLTWKTYGIQGAEGTVVFEDEKPIALFLGPDAIRMERVALFLTTEQS